MTMSQWLCEEGCNGEEHGINLSNAKVEVNRRALQLEINGVPRYQNKSWNVRNEMNGIWGHVFALLGYTGRG